MKETPTQLRYALRLIHSLQKERGASASYYAYTISHPVISNNNTDAVPLTGIGASLNAATVAVEEPENSNPNAKGKATLPADVHFSDALFHARQGTDVAFHMIIKYENEIMAPGRKCTVWADALQRVRNKIDECCLIFTGVKEPSHSTDADAAVTEDFMTNSLHGNYKIIGSHRVIVMFNILIGNVMDEIVLQVIHREINWMKQKYRCRTGPASAGENPRNYSDRLRQSLPGFNREMANIGGGIGVSSEHEHSISLERQSRHHSQHELNVLGDSPEEYEKPCQPNFFARSLPIDAVDASLDNSCYGHGQPADHLGEGPPTSTAMFSNGRLMDASRLLNNYRMDYPHSNSHSTGRENGVRDLDHCMSSSLQLSSPELMEYEIPIATSVPVATLEDAARKLKQSSTKLNDKVSTSSTENSSHDVRQMLDLLTVLLSFTQLKESTGVERSIVCSLMALSSEDEDSDRRTKQSTSKLFNDLVVEEANQRMIVRDLQQQSKVLQPSSLSLLKMIEKFVRPGREMESVQDKIKDFDLEGVQNSMKLIDFWKVITAYIDQLHALELLIVEEVQLSREMLILKGKGDEDDTNKAGRNGVGVKSSPSIDFLENHLSMTNPSEESNVMKGNSAILDILRSDADISMDKAIQELGKLPAEQIKQRLLHFMNGNGDSLESSPQIQDVIDIEDEVKNPLMKTEPSHNLNEWEIDLYEIEFQQRIGRGVAGTTYLAKWSGQKVAVKVAAITDLGLEGWYTEVHSLKRLHHPNVIRLLGSIYNPSPQTYGLVLEYCNSGDLSKALHRPTPANFFWKIADDVANGMSYLHRKMIMHRDIKPANILLDGDVQGGNFSAKLTDFGVAVMHSGLEEHTAETGTYRWMAPEVIRHESYSFLADVYSYALVVWQLVTRENPFKSISQIEAAGKVAIDDARPPFPSGTPELIMTLIDRCWSKWPDDRLPFAQITIELKEIHRVLSEKDKSWLREPEGHPVYEVKEKKAPFLGGKGSKDSEKGRRSRGSSPRGRAKRRGSGSSQASQKSQNGNGLFSFFLKR